MLFVLIVGFRLLAFIILLIKSSVASILFCCIKKKSAHDTKYMIKNGFIIVEKSVVVEVKNEKSDDFSRL